MKKIFKYDITNDVTIYAPAGTKLLSIQNQHNRICIWMEIDVEEVVDTTSMEFKIAVTGGDVPVGMDYLTTVQLDEGTFVAHIYWKESAL